MTYYLILLDGASNCDAHKKKTRAEEGIHDDHFTIGHRAWRRAGCVPATPNLKAGLGSASAQTSAGVIVAALAVVNAVGSVT